MNMKRIEWEGVGDNDGFFEVEVPSASDVERVVMRNDEVKHGQYRCEMCLEIFDYGWTEEEAKAEADANGLDVDDCGLVCDDCYKKTPWGRADA